MRTCFRSVEEVAQYLTGLSDCLHMRLLDDDLATLSAAASFLIDHQDREYQRWKSAGGGYQPRPTVAPPGRPPSGGGSGRK